MMGEFLNLGWVRSTGRRIRKEMAKMIMAMMIHHIPTTSPYWVPSSGPPCKSSLFPTGGRSKAGAPRRVLWGIYLANIRIPHNSPQAAVFSIALSHQQQPDVLGFVFSPLSNYSSENK
jgi:hypothetical protein